MVKAAEIASKYDEVKDAAAVAKHFGITPGRVYTVLRRHRPDRERKPREQTSEKREQIKLYRNAGIDPARIAVLLQCTRQWVYKVLGE